MLVHRTRTTDITLTHYTHPLINTYTLHTAPPSLAPTEAPTAVGWWSDLPGWGGSTRGGEQEKREPLNMGVEACVWSERIDPGNLDCRCV
jgi:hypothetical protein